MARMVGTRLRKGWRRAVIWGGLGAVVGMAVLAYPLTCYLDMRDFEERYHAITAGMTLAEVERVMGWPHDEAHDDPMELARLGWAPEVTDAPDFGASALAAIAHIRTWYGRHQVVVVTFRKGQVTNKNHRLTGPPSFWRGKMQDLLVRCSLLPAPSTQPASPGPGLPPSVLPAPFTVPAFPAPATIPTFPVLPPGMVPPFEPTTPFNEPERWRPGNGDYPRTIPRSDALALNRDELSGITA
jgi:hypothetical protein